MSSICSFGYLNTETPDQNSNFSTFELRTTLGVSKTPTWIKVSCSRDAIGKVLSLDYALLDTVEIYDKNFKKQKENIGEMGFDRLRYFPSQYPNLEINDTLVYLKIVTEGAKNIFFSIHDPYLFKKRSQKESLLSGFFLSFFLAIGIYNLFYFIALRKVTYLYYFLYAISQFFLQAILLGIASHMLWPNNPGWINTSVAFFFSVFFCTSSIFTYNYLQIQRGRFGLKLLYHVLISVNIILAGLSFYLPYIKIIKIIQLMLPIVTIINLYISILRVIQGFRPGYYHIAGWGFFLVCSLFAALRDLTVIDGNVFVDHAYRVGAVIETFVLSLGVGSYFNEIEKTKKKKDDELEAMKSSIESTVRSVQMLAHEIKKPFANLRLALDSIQKLENKYHINRFSNLIKQEVTKNLMMADKMTSEVLDFGRAASTERQVENLGLIVHAALLSSVNFTRKSGVNFTIKLDGRTTIYADSVAVIRLFENLIVNALQHTTAGDELEIQAKEKLDLVHIKLKNTGSSIAKNDLENIFRPFFSKGKKNGTGLGLSICKKIVLEHGQQIYCESEVNSVTFRFSLPLANRQIYREIEWPQSTNMPILSTKPDDYLPISTDELHAEMCKLGRSIRIALVEDERIYRDNLKSLVEPMFYEFVKFEDFSSPESILSSNSDYDLYLIDNDLGTSMSGIELINVMTERNVEGEIYLHSNIDNSLVSEAIKLIPKPMSRQQLYRLLYDFLKVRV